MIVTKNIRCITSIARNILSSNGGYVVAPIRAASFKTDLKIKWVRPEKIASIRPEKSGDLGLELGITENQPAKFFEKSKELETADEIVKKMFTLEFLPRKNIETIRREKILATVKRHEADRGSMESRIAVMTSEIHNLQELMIKHPRMRVTAHFLKELIDKRRRYLGKLRTWDYRRFEWLLEKLNLVYKPNPIKYEPVTRKKSMRRLTKMHCTELTQAKMDKLKAELDTRKNAFFLEKSEKLQFIRNEEIACGKEPTVTEEDIAEAKSRAAEYEKKEEIRRGVAH